jgi:hypothetical protein
MPNLKNVAWKAIIMLTEIQIQFFLLVKKLPQSCHCLLNTPLCLFVLEYEVVRLVKGDLVTSHYRLR